MNKYTRDFGIELEVSSSREAMKEILGPYLSKFNYNPDMGYVESRGKSWDLKYDSSTECELATPIMTLKSKEFRIFKRIVKELKKNKVKTTKNDGLHLHINCSDVSKDAVTLVWILFERAFLDILPSHRRGHGSSFATNYMETYADGKRVASVANIFVDNRYKVEDHHTTVNGYYYDVRKTFEFRPFPGTLDIVDIENWTKLCLSFISYVKKKDNKKDLINIMCKSIGQYNILDMMVRLDIRSKQLQSWVEDQYDKYA